MDSITRSAILVLPQTQKIAGGIVYTTKLSGFKSFRIQSSHYEFKISRDMAKPGSFYIGFDKTNSVLKHSGFVTNLEQFPLV